MKYLFISVILLGVAIIANLVGDTIRDHEIKELKAKVIILEKQNENPN